MRSPTGETEYTKLVVGLTKRIQGSSQGKNSLFELAGFYFTSASSDRRTLATYQQEFDAAKESLHCAPTNKISDAKSRLKSAERVLKNEQQRQQSLRVDRHKLLTAICLSTLELCEGVSWEETQVKSAKLLGTLSLLSPSEGKTYQQVHHLYKPLYKAVLALRLLDKLLDTGGLEHKYLRSRYDKNSRFPPAHGQITHFQRDVAIPVIVAALLQDVGMEHPEIQRLLKGPDGSLDEFRVLDKDMRVPLLIMNHEQTMEFITEGIGNARYAGQTEEARAEFMRQDNNRLSLIRGLLNGAIKPKLDIGNIIKVPQIYTSVILSTKSCFNINDQPKAATMIEHTALKGAISPNAAKCFVAITGHFPQGFGIVFTDAGEQIASTYQYAIVSAINPKSPHIPKCRVLKSLNEFDAKEVLISKNRNMYYKDTRNKLRELDKEKLEKIRQQIMEKFEQVRNTNLLPSYWDPHNYFCIKQHQKLWD
ncbi:MAG: hypothetical protein ACI88A_000604 [Paraglaciecola sp.]|jgi:hypothetical protein